MADIAERALAWQPEELDRLFRQRARAGDVEGRATAEVARRQSDGSRRWVADKPQVL